MKITSRGQVTIPRDIREATGLLPETEVEFVVRGRDVLIVKARAGSPSVSGLRKRASTKMSTDQILKLTRG